MKIQKALERIAQLDEKELRHFVQLCDTELQSYRSCITNYPPDRLEKYGLPMMRRLQDNRDRFAAELARRTGTVRKTIGKKSPRIMESARARFR